MKKTFFATCLLSLGFFAGSAWAQGKIPSTAPRGSQGEIEESLRVRGMPLRLVEELRSEAPKLVGRNDGEDGFRSRTPLLNKAKGRGRKVDVEALRRRKIAMFEEGAVFTDAVPFVGPNPEPLVPKKTEKPKVEEEGVALWKVLASIGLLTISGIFAWVSLRSKP